MASSIGKNVEIVEIPSISDGDPTKIPPPEWKLVNPAHLYLNKIAEMWKEPKPGMKHYLDKLPAGYRVYERARPQDPKTIDKHLHGHPSGKYFDSPNRFFPHFKHLMENGSNVGCPCTICTGSRSKPVTGKIKGKGNFFKGPGKPTPCLDEENTPDTLQNLLHKFTSTREPVNKAISENLSLDWRATRDALHEWLKKLAEQPSWLPRQGEVVLFLREPQQEELNAESKWEAGVVAQVPEDSDSGFRIEPLPDPNSTDKSFSKRHCYVSVRYIRPFLFWQQVVGTSENEWHPTVRHAMKLSSCVSLVAKYRLNAMWPNATVRCRGIYIGHEFISEGDTVRFKPPKAPSGAIDFLKVDAIKNKIEVASQGASYDASSILLSGKAYTYEASRSWQNKAVASKGKGLSSLCGRNTPLYWRHNPVENMQVSFSCIVGRAFEIEVIEDWFPKATDRVTYGLRGSEEARRFSSKKDSRIAPGKMWYWANTRLRALGLESLNNIDGTDFDIMRPERLETWQRLMKKNKTGEERSGGEDQPPSRKRSRSVEEAYGARNCAKEVSVEDHTAEAPLDTFKKPKVVIDLD